MTVSEIQILEEDFPWKGDQRHATAELITSAGPNFKTKDQHCLAIESLDYWSIILIQLAGSR